MAEQDKTLWECRIFRVIEREQTGRSGAVHKRYIVKHPGGVGVLPVLDSDHVVLIRQYRIAVDQYIYEIPAGLREAKEMANPEETARRELKEETGYTAARWARLPSIWSSPGFCAESIDIFLAEDLTPGETALEDGEDLSTEILDREQIKAMIQEEKIKDAKTLVALLAWLNGAKA